MTNQIQRDQQILSCYLEKYIQIILAEYNNIIPNEKKEFLTNIDDYTNLIKTDETGTISLFVRNNKIYLPISAYQAIEEMKKNPQFGSNKNHLPYTEDTMLLNNNTFFDYIQHVVLKGLSAREYFEEILLHETMHLCGSGGASALREGFTELKTRQLAKKYHLNTSCCGYPKEVEIVYQLEQILGKEVTDKIAFANNDLEIYRLIQQEVGQEEADLYQEIDKIVTKNFMPYMAEKYPGINGPQKKTETYNKIDYSEAKQLLNQYNKAHNLSSPLVKKRTLNQGFSHILIISFLNLIILSLFLLWMMK